MMTKRTSASVFKCSLIRSMAVVALTLAAGGPFSGPTVEAQGPADLASAQNGLGEIQQLAGCFEVSYRFVEDGIHDIFSERYGLNATTKEWVGFQKTGQDTFLLQHVFFLGSRPMPHWHEIWIWHPDTQAWTQEVWGGAPGPASGLRYRCMAPWTGNRWECHAGRAEKPFRDDGAPFGFKRDDYDWLDRRNILLVTPNGWVQNEDNRKMGSSGELVSHELGWITYARIPEERCETAPQRFPKDMLGPAAGR
jgi:hypothetical protein